MRALLVLLVLAGTTSPGFAEPGRTQAAGLRLIHPSDWTRAPAPSDMRAAQFRVPKVAGDPEDAEAVLFFFGPGTGGGARENRKRAHDRKRQPTGRHPEDA